MSHASATMVSPGSFGPVQRAEVALAEGATAIEIDIPRERELHPGEMVGLTPRRYRIFAA